MNDTFILPLFGGGGPSPTQYYTKAEVDALIEPFVTNAVDDLANYYLKSETYTQAEVQSLIGSIEHFIVVDTLPTTDIRTNVIYLLGPIGSGTDKYEEWIYSNSQWVKIGETSIDLSGYYTKSETDSLLDGVKPVFDLADATQERLADFYANYETYQADNILQYEGKTVLSVSPMDYGGMTLLMVQYDLNLITNEASTDVPEGYVNVRCGAKLVLPDGTMQGFSGGGVFPSKDVIDGIESAIESKQDVLTAGTGISIADNVISATGGGGGGNDWFGTQSEFDELGEYDPDTNYFISDRIEYSEIKGAPNMANYYKKVEVDAKDLVLEGKIRAKTEISYMTQEEFDDITPLEGKVYAIEGITKTFTVTYADETTETFNVVVD